MPYADLREYIHRLEEEGDLMRIKKEVDWNLELGAIMRRANDLREPALLFEKIKDYSSDYRVLANVIGATKPNPYGRLCLALDLPKETPPLDSYAIKSENLSLTLENKRCHAELGSASRFVQRVRS